MPAQSKPSLDTISEGWQQVTRRNRRSRAQNPVSSQDASSSSFASESEYPTSEHIESIGSLSGTPSEHSASRASRATSQSDPGEGSSAGAAAAATAAESGSLSSPISATSSSSSDGSSISGSGELSIPGVQVFSVASLAGAGVGASAGTVTQGPANSSLASSQANSSSSASATGPASVDDGIFNSEDFLSGRLHVRVAQRRPMILTDPYAVLSSQPTSGDMASYRRLVRERDMARARAQESFAGRACEAIFSQRRTEEAYLATKGYSPRDLHPDPLRSHPLRPSCPYCRGTPNSRPPHPSELCLPCHAGFVNHVREEHGIPPTHSSLMYYPEASFMPSPVERVRRARMAMDNTIAARVAARAPARAENATVANGAERTGSHASSTANSANTADTANTANTANNDNGSGTSGISDPNDEEYDEGTRLLFMSGIPVTAMLEFSETPVGDFNDSSIDSDESDDEMETDTNSDSDSDSDSGSESNEDDS